MALAGDYNPSHSINVSLVAFVGSHAVGSAILGTERVNGGTITAFGDADFTRTHPDVAAWRSLDSRSATTAGAAFALTSQIQTITTVHSIWVDATVDSLGAWSMMIGIPWASGTWTAPFAAIALNRSSSTTATNHQFVTSGPTANAYTGASGSFPTSGRHRYWVIRNGTNLKFGADGSQVGSDATVASGSTIYNTSQPLTMLNRSSTSIGEGIDGSIHCLRIWSRALSTTEMGDLNTDPQLGIYLADTPILTQTKFRVYNDDGTGLGEAP